MCTWVSCLQGHGGRVSRDRRERLYPEGHVNGLAFDRTMRQRYLDLLFFTGFAFLLCHELDAVAQAEWRLLPFLSGMNDGDAYVVFVVLHIPLLALLLWWTGATVVRTRQRSQLFVDAFLVIHAGLHTALRSHGDYTFHTTLSDVCIYGAAALGLIHAALSVRSARH